MCFCSNTIYQKGLEMRKIAILLSVMGLMLSALAGTALAQNLVGNGGNNKLLGTAENDVLRGLGGNDYLNGRGDSDRLYGGAGNDVIQARDGEGDFIDCGSGKKDTVVADADNEDRISKNCEIVKKPAGGADDNGNHGPNHQ